MAFSFLPKEDQYFALFSQMTAKIQEAAGYLVIMMSGPYDDMDSASKRIKSVEHEFPVADFTPARSRKSDAFSIPIP